MTTIDPRSTGFSPERLTRVSRLLQGYVDRGDIAGIIARVGRRGQLAKLPLAFQPGTRWGYSMSIDLLGALVEILSGQTLDAFCEERIFKPLGMPDTGFFLPPEKAERRAIVYGEMTAVRGRRRMDEMAPPPERPSYINGGGGLVSTIEDYSRFAQMLTGGGQVDGVRLLAPSTMALFSLNHLAPGVKLIGMDPRDPRHAGYGYSLGTRVLVDVAESGCAGNVGEFGWDGLFNTYFWIDPKEQLYGLILLQQFPFGEYPIHREFKQTVYQALVG